MAILAIVPGKPNMCLQENLADCVDCGGLGIADNVFEEEGSEHVNVI